MILAGEVRGVEQRSGGSGDSAFSYTQVHILEGVNMHQARIGREYGPNVPRVGEQIVAQVEVNTFTRRNGTAGSSVTLVRPVDESVVMGLLDIVSGTVAAA